MGDANGPHTRDRQLRPGWPREKPPVTRREKKCAKAPGQGGVLKTGRGRGGGEGPCRTIWGECLRGEGCAFYPGCHGGPHGSGMMRSTFQDGSGCSVSKDSLWLAWPAWQEAEGVGPAPRPSASASFFCFSLCSWTHAGPWPFAQELQIQAQLLAFCLRSTDAADRTEAGPHRPLGSHQSSRRPLPTESSRTISSTQMRPCHVIARPAGAVLELLGP